MTIFGERFLLPLFAALVITVVVTNVFKLDWTYRGGVLLLLFGAGIIVAHSIEASRSRRTASVPTEPPPTVTGGVEPTKTEAESTPQPVMPPPTQENKMATDHKDRASAPETLIDGHVQGGRGGDGIAGEGGEGGTVHVHPPGPVRITGPITGGAGGDAARGGKGGKGGDVHIQPEQARPGQKGHDLVIQPEPGHDLKIIGGQGGGVTNENGVHVGDVNVSGNSAPTQVNIGSPGATQIVNPRRILKPKVRLEREERGGKKILRVLFDQTEGNWEPGENFWVQLAFSGPYLRAKIISGLQNAMTDVVTTEGDPDALAAGRYEMKTATPPIPGVPVILEVESAHELTITDLKARPTQ